MSAIEKLINVCENRQVADTAQAELTTLRDELAQDRQAVAVLAGDLQSCQIENEKLIKELAQCRGELKTHHEKARGNYWAWQGDGEDYPESLSCPVLMSANQLRGILAEHDTLKGERDALRNVLDAGKGQSAISILWEQNEKTQAERDTLKGENERLKGDVAEADRIAQNAAETEQQTANRASRIEQHCLGLSKALTSHRLLLDEMGKQLTAAKIALRSYQFGNGSTELAQEIADAIEPALTKYQQQCGEKVKV